MRTLRNALSLPLTLPLVLLLALSSVARLSAAEPPAESPPEGYQKTAPQFEKLGSHHHPISTRVALAQQYFDQGLALAFGFNHAEAARSFREVQKLDPNCAMGYWGEAFVLGPNINAPMDPADVPAAWAALQRALQLAEHASPAERDYIHALATRYRPEPVEDRTALDQAFAQAMLALAEKYPDDDDALIFAAEAVMDTTPWDYWLKDGRPKPGTERVLPLLERVLARSPDHPHANHLYIHAVEAAHPTWGIACADRLGPLAPDAGHLVHMPAHIYIRVGRYADAIEANEKAILADQSYITQCHAQGLYPLAYMPHNHHFLWFAAAMEGRRQRAMEAAHHMAHHVDPKMMREPGYGALQHFSLLPFYTLIRFGDWKAVLAEPAPAEDLKYPTGIWRYGRGLAQVRGGEVDQARQELAALRELAADESLQEVTIWGKNSAQQVLTIAAHVLAGELAAAQGDAELAVRHLRQAVELEDALAYDEPPAWYAPVRPMLGAVLLEAGRPQEAEAAYWADLAIYPANAWSLFGLEQALRAQDKAAEADQVHAQFQAAWARADVPLTRSAN